MAASLLPEAARAAMHTANVPAPTGSIQLWPGDPPGLRDVALTDHSIDRTVPGGPRDRAYDRVRMPRLDLFPATNPNGAAVLITPGGGYARVVIDKEGYELAAWLQARGVSAFVLFYRLPAQGWADPANTPLADAQRAIRLIRARAEAWRIDPARIATIGFSAGGHLCADGCTRFDTRTYAPVDAADAHSARPMLAAPIYPVVSMDPAIAHAGSRTNLLGPAPDAAAMAEHSPDRQVRADTPPCFLVHAEDDATVPVENSLRFRAALKAAGVPVETHLFERGGHGFGLRGAARLPAAAWPELWHRWAAGHGLFDAGRR
ncbi:alpha/beta hydrolase [Sphingomonas elodea]|uniref:alpha/beta hydrolase n=1 Tax=Sphingomonas elodea TaxID=179878 RepID=UPI000263169B